MNIPEQQVLSGVTPEAAAPIDSNPVQPTAQNVEPAAQPTTEGLGTVPNQEAIPYERFQQMNESNKAAVDSLQQQLNLSQQQNQLYQANMQQVQQQPPTQSRLEQIASKIDGIGDDESLYGKEAKEMLSAFQGEMSDFKASQVESQKNTFQASNPDYSDLVVKDSVLGPQYQPEFIEMLKANPVIHQQLQMMEGNPVQQQQAALNFARQYQQSKAQNVPGQTALAPVPGQVPLNAPPSLSAIPTPMGTNQSVTSYASMNNADFLKMANSMKQTT